MESMDHRKDGTNEMEDIKPSQQEIVGGNSSDALLEHIKCGFDLRDTDPKVRYLHRTSS